MKLLPITITGKTLSTTASPAVKGDKDIDALSIAVPVSYEGTNLAQDAWHIRFKLPGGTVHTDPLTDGVPDDAEAPTILTFTYPMQGLIVSQSGNVALQIINVPADGSSIFQTLPGPSITVSGTLEGPPSADYNAAPWGTYLAQYEAIRDETKQYRDEAVDGAASALESASNAQESATQAAGSATDSHNSELAAKGYEEGAGLIKGAIDSLVASAPFQAVVGVADDIPTVAEVAEDIPAVAGAAPSIPTLAGVAEEVALLGPVATQIGQLSLIKDHIVSLEAEKLKVVAVEAKLTEIQGVYAKLAEIEGVYGKSTEIDALYAQLDTIAAKANQADLDAVEARVDASELTLARQGQDLASVKQTLQQGNGATLDFSGIGSVALDARATGRANPTLEGRTATNLVPVMVDANSNNLVDGWSFDGAINLSFSDGVQIFTASKSNGAIYKSYEQYIQFASHVMMVIAKVKVTSVESGVRLWVYDGASLNAGVYHSGSGQWEVLKHVFTVSAAPASFSIRVRDYRTTGFTEIQFGEVALLDLTSIYGSGNEPSESDCAKIFSYFDGTKSGSMPARVRSVGKNLWDLDTPFTTNGGVIIEKRKDIFGYASSTSIVSKYAYFNFVVTPGVQYTAKWVATKTAGATSAYGNILVTDANGTVLLAETTISTGRTFTSTTTQVTIRITLSGGFGDLTTGTITYPQLEVGSIATAYEPYTDSTLYIADDSELRSVPAISDEIKVVNGELVKVQNVQAAALPTTISAGAWIKEVTNNAGRDMYRLLYSFPNGSPSSWTNTDRYTLRSSLKGVIAQYTLWSGATIDGWAIFAPSSIDLVVPTGQNIAGYYGTLTIEYALATPIITPLLTSGILQAKPNGSVSWEPYYEGSHQTNASSQITLPHEGTIDKVTGYDEDLEPYEVPSTGYTLVGTLLTITGAEENEVFYVELRRSEPLAPEMSVNTLNNEQVIADTTNGKFYKLVPTITNGALVSQTPVEVV